MWLRSKSVSYTHLDVYKRQQWHEYGGNGADGFDADV